MKPLKGGEILGNWATLLLPIEEDDTINYGKLEDEIALLIDARVDGIYSNGTAGEFHNLTEKEFDRVSELLALRSNAANMPFQLGVSHMSPVLSLERLKRVVSLAPSAVQVILPDWYPTTERENIVFLSRMAEVCDPIGLVLYNPPHAKKVLTPAEIGRLSKEVSGLVGLKVRDGGKEWYEDMNTHCDNLSVFVPGHHLATGIRSGAHGSYSNVACLNPLAAQRWYDSIRFEPDAALELEMRIIAFFEKYIRPLIIERKFSAPSIDKLLAAIGGWSSISNRLRWPYCSVPYEDVAKLRTAAYQELPEFFNIR